MKDPYHLVRALEVILSLNGDVLKGSSALEKAKELASRGLSNYNAPDENPKEDSKTCQCICLKQNLNVLQLGKK